jgi:acetolactate synthase-1/3 small subunit
VIDFTGEEYVERELALIKVNAEADSRAEALRIVDIFRANVVDVTPKSYTIQITGAPAKIDGLLELLRPMGIKEIVRSGPVVMGRGAKGVTG